MAASDATAIPIKNQAFRVMFPIIDNDGDIITGAAGLDSEISKDCGAMADCTNEASEITGSGMYYLDLTATEMNADSVVIIVKTTTTDAKTTPLVLYPAENGDIPVDVTMVSGDATAATNMEADYDGTGYNKSASTVGTVTTNTDMRGTDGANTTTPPTVVQIREEVEGVASVIYGIDATCDTMLANQFGMMGSGFNSDLHSLLALRNRGDIAWTTATGFSVPNEYDTVLTAIQAKTDHIGEGIAKGAALNAFTFSMFDLNGNPATGLTVALYIAKDGGSFTLATNTVVETGMGFYDVDLTALEMDANVIALGATATGAGQCSLTIVTV